jgi:hypothetical protein
MTDGSPTPRRTLRQRQQRQRRRATAKRSDFQIENRAYIERRGLKPSPIGGFPELELSDILATRRRPNRFWPATLPFFSLPLALLRGFASRARKRLPPEKTDGVALRSANAIAFPVPEKALALATSILGEAKVASADATQNHRTRGETMKTTYRAEFFTAADYAYRDFEAATPEQALQLARQFYDDNLIELDFRSYDDNAGLDQIQIWDSERGTLATWESDYYRLREAAAELLTALKGQTAAAEAVIGNWEKGDLAAAVHALDEWIAPARNAIAKATPTAA